MKVTIYELLGMIKDGKAPKKIKVTGTIYYFDEEFNFYFTKTKKGNFALGGKLNEINLLYNFDNENEVEIIEPQEHKIPEKFKVHSLGDKDEYGNYVDSPFPTNKELMNKINEILDCLEEIE